jgi:integrase
MATKDELIPSGIQNVFYREHPTRKHGVQKDRQWIIFQRIDGKRRVSTIGWSSEGVTRGQVDDKAAEYKANNKWNKANPDQPPKPICKADEDAAAEKLKQELDRKHKAEKQKNITIGEYFKTRYLPLQINNGKKSAYKEEQLFRLHIAPVLAKFTFNDAMPLHIEKIGHSMKNKGKSPTTINYTYAVVRQMWNLANVDGITDRQHPTKQIKKPKLNNKRERFITREEEALLLDALKERSEITHDMAMMSLDTGARWGELAALTWDNLNLEGNTARLMDTKSGDNRTIHTTTTRVKEMLLRRHANSSSQYVFPARDGGMQEQTNVVFARTVEDIGLNDGVKDQRKKVCFHTMRHTFASRLAMAGVPLYTIKEAMGHHTIAMTERYAHLMPDTLREAMQVLEEKPDNVVELNARNSAK